VGTFMVVQTKGRPCRMAASHWIGCITLDWLHHTGLAASHWIGCITLDWLLAGNHQRAPDVSLVSPCCAPGFPLACPCRCWVPCWRTPRGTWCRCWRRGPARACASSWRRTCSRGSWSSSPFRALIRDQVRAHPTSLYCTILSSTFIIYCTVLYCAVQFCAVLCCTVLCCAVLCCTVMCFTVLFCAVLHSI